MDPGLPRISLALRLAAASTSVATRSNGEQAGAVADAEHSTCKRAIGSINGSARPNSGCTAGPGPACSATRGQPSR